MRKSLFMMVALALFVGQAIASPVSVEQARHLGMKYVQSHSAKQIASLDLAYTQLTESGINALYVFNFDQGYVIVSADDVAYPILSFGEGETFDINSIPDGLAYYLGHYARQIDYAVNNGLQPDAEVAAQWEHVMRDGFENDNRSTRGDIAPLISTNWNQDNPYNLMCPTAGGGPGGHVYAGCVATAMSMVMKYWNWPDHGQGSHSYTPSGYPTQSVNFEETTYNWSSMPNSCNNSNYQAVALLMWHCGVAVDMQYSPSGSGAYSVDVPGAINNYFRYTSHTDHLSRDQYTKTEWEDMLIRNLEYGFPLYYSGSDANGGHAFACCGYRESDRKFYFNWGWSGYMNNYFAIDALNCGYNGSFNQNQTAIYDFVPDYIYDALIPAVTDLEVSSENANSKTGVITWTNPTTNLVGETVENIEQVVLVRNGVQIFSQNNVIAGEKMSFTDVVNEYDCYTYRLYYVTNGTKGRFADVKFQYGPTCTWKLVGQTSNFQGWNGGKVQVLNSFGTVIQEVTMTSSTPISQQMRMPVGDVSFRWVAPATAVTNMTIMIKNSANATVYNFTGNSNQLNGVIHTDNNDCGGCEPPTALAGEYQWTNEGFGTMLTWSYDTDPQSFKVYRSNDGITYEEVATVDKTLREYFDIAGEGDYYYKVTAYRSYCESTPAWASEGVDYVYVTVTSVDECQQNSSIYPNPANSYLTVEAEGLQEVTIYNMMGQVVLQQRCCDNATAINTSNLSSGIYTIAIKSTAETSITRFTVNH